ncbi:NAD(P)/FAD-dependent oxidoreductase [Flavobacterium sp.]|uniref:NAD(P)/FAD-dependent oxidoreductase n=1 Tax=Flavobacterium sp. TaxID=239 RepID=UPI0039E386FC
MIDYLIVGSGLAGIAFSETALQHGKSIRVFDNHSQQSSSVAAGLYNPVILKRFSGLQQAQQQLYAMQRFYEILEPKIGVVVNHRMPILRKFFSVEEQNNWFTASDKPNLSAFLSTELIHQQYPGIESPFGFGEVLQTGYVDTARLVQSYREYLSSHNWFDGSGFDYSQLEITADFVRYKDIEARQIVFAEGFGIKHNPYFNYLPLNGTKGELMIVRAPELKLDAIVKGNVFVLPIGNDLFKIGATYNWEDKTNEPTAEGRKELVEKANEILHCDYEIVSHLAGIRPTVKDRKPLLGTHPQYQNLHVFNGLGTRGVMLAPLMAQILFESIEEGKTIDRELRIERFG